MPSVSSEDLFLTQPTFLQHLQNLSCENDCYLHASNKFALTLVLKQRLGQLGKSLSFLKLAVVSVMPFDAICETREVVFLFIVQKTENCLRWKEKTNNQYRVLWVLDEMFLCYLSKPFQCLMYWIPLFVIFQECSGTIDPKGGATRCYFAVSPKKLTVLDDKTKVRVGVK